MKRRMAKRERGYVLLIAASVTIALTLLGIVVLNTTFFGSEFARADRHSQQALYNAEAGIAWAMELLENDPYQISQDADYTRVLQAISALPDVVDPAWPTSVLPQTTWHSLHSESFVQFSKGGFRVAIQDDADDDNPLLDTNKTILVRSYGFIRLGDEERAARLIEITLSSSSDNCALGGM